MFSSFCRFVVVHFGTIVWASIGFFVSTSYEMKFVFFCCTRVVVKNGGQLNVGPIADAGHKCLPGHRWLANGDHNQEWCFHSPGQVVRRCVLSKHSCSVLRRFGCGGAVIKSAYSCHSFRWQSFDYDNTQQTTVIGEPVGRQSIGCSGNNDGCMLSQQQRGQGSRGCIHQGSTRSIWPRTNKVLSEQE